MGYASKELHSLRESVSIECLTSQSNGVLKTKVNGQCHCGKISLKAEVSENMMMACHCKDCQIFSGAPFRAVAVASAENVEIKGEAKEYVKVADSGNKRIQAFCGDCGTQLYATDLEKTMFNIRAGFLEQHHQIVPKKHIFGSSTAAWLADIDEQAWVTAGPKSEPLKS